ncbi:MAG: hypothetical protein U0V73_05685 [Acidimicrobiia bacterium]
MSVLDASALIRFKELVSVSDQWAAFKALEERVVQGSLALPRRVITEVSGIAHPDLPGAWAPGVRPLQVHPLDPEWDVVAEVMRQAGDVVDPNKQDEDADPYVLALGLQLQREGFVVEIVTDDRIDRTRIAMTTACARLGLTSTSPSEFLAACGIKASKVTE